MEDCIFCKIVNKELPCYKVFEDDKVISFLDINPVNKGHVLVVPKEHMANLEEASEECLCNIILTVRNVSSKLSASLGNCGYNIIVNKGECAGQIVNHLHFHIIPRFAGDSLKGWDSVKYNEGEAEIFLSKILNQ